MSKLDRNQFIQHLLALYQATPGTRGRIRTADQRLAEQLHDNGASMEVIRVALLLAATRRSYRPLDAYPLQPVASLHDFVPVIQEKYSKIHSPSIQDITNTSSTRLPTSKNRFPTRPTIDCREQEPVDCRGASQASPQSANRPSAARSRWRRAS